MSKRARPDVEPTVAFLCTRVSCLNVDNWKKLGRMIGYLNRTIDDKRVIGVSSLKTLVTWVDAAYALYGNMRSQTGGILSFGLRAIQTKSSKQKINAKSSTEAELIGVSEVLPYNIWMTNFLKAQGYELEENILMQDNMSAIKMEKKRKKILYREFSSHRRKIFFYQRQS